MRASVIVVLLLAGLSTLGQTLHVEHYDVLRRNVPLPVNVIFQDHTGYIWIGSAVGLYRFDGSSFRAHAVGNSDQDMIVTALAEDSLGRLWIGSASGKIGYLGGQGYTVFDPEEGLSAKPVSDLLFDNRGRLWFSTIDDGLYYYVHERLYRLDEQEGLPDLYIYDLHADASGNVWAGTDGGLVQCTVSDAGVTLQVYDQSNGLADNIVKRIKSDGSDLFLATEDAGVLVRNAEGQFTQLVRSNWEYGPIQDIEVQGDQVWVSTQGQGLLAISTNGQSLNHYRQDGLSAINELYSDAEGSLWVSNRSGLARTPGNRIEYLLADSNPPENVLALTVTPDDVIWYSTGSGVNFLKPGSNTPTRLSSKVLQGVTDHVISMYADGKGNVWAGLFGSGLLRYDTRSGVVVRISNELRNGSVMQITGQSTDLWLATLGGGVRLSENNGKYSAENYGRQEGISSDYVYQVLVDSKGRAWFATDREGVDCLAGGGIRHFPELESEVVFGFAEDPNGSIWANVQGEGLFRLEGDEFVVTGSDSLLPELELPVFTLGKRGELVTAHQQGLTIFDHQGKLVASLGEETGWEGRIPNLNAVGRMNDGSVVIGTDRGIVRYTGGTLARFHRPRPYIESIVLPDLTVRGEADAGFRYDQNDLAFHYLAFWYQQPGDISYRYKLEAHDRDWIISTDRSVVYSSLNPGQYTFRLQASLDDNFFGSEEAVVQITIHPPFWKQAWFVGLGVVAFGFLAAAVVKLRERNLRQAKDELEQKVKQRTREIEEMNVAVQLQAEQIKAINENLEDLVRKRTSELELKNQTLEEYAFMNAHNLRSPVASILGLINLMDRLDLDGDQRSYLQHLKSSAESLDKVVRSITRRIEKGQGL